MATTINITARTLPAGHAVLGPLPVPVGLTSLALRIDATQHMNPGVVFTFGVELSYDGGTTWAFAASTTREGGVAFGDQGVVENNMGLSLALDQPNNTQRRIRATVDLVGGSLVTAGGTVTVS